MLRFGSLTARVCVDRPEFLDLLTEYYRLTANVVREGDSLPSVDLELSITAGCRPLPVDSDATDGIETVAGPGQNETIVRTALAEASLRQDGQVARLQILVCESGPVNERIKYHVFIVLNKVLAQLGYVHVHAAAVRLGERTYMFAGDKGAGKSTICLALARAGGTVIAEDHVMLRRRPDGYAISGSDGVLRVTAQTEAFFFDTPLDVTPMPFAGVPKKEIPIEMAVPCAPYKDFPVDVLCMPRVAARLEIAQASRRVALVHFMEALLWQHRFENAGEQARHLAFLADFVQSVSVYALSLSGDVVDLQKLAPLLGRL